MNWIVISLLFFYTSEVSGISEPIRSIKVARGGANKNTNSNYDNYGDDETSVASIQYMITQRMRRVLVNELGYLPEEVDEMAPEVAAVVIERGLSRPSNGMPSSWRRKVQRADQFVSTIKSFPSHISGFFHNLGSFIRLGSSKLAEAIKSKQTLPAVAIISIIIFRGEIGGLLRFFGGSSLDLFRVAGGALRTLWRDTGSAGRTVVNGSGKILLSVRRIVTKSSGFVWRSLFVRPVQFVKATAKKRQPPPVDLSSLESLQHPSLFDRARLRYHEFKRNVL